MNALAEACTKCYGKSDGRVINSCWEGSGKVTEKSLHLEGDRKFSQRLGEGIPGRELSRIKAKESESARCAQATWTEYPGGPRAMCFFFKCPQDIFTIISQGAPTKCAHFQVPTHTYGFRISGLGPQHFLFFTSPLDDF